MRVLKGLIAFFSLIFLLSAISLILLVIDDQKDLSSRASIMLGGNVKTLEKYKTAESSRNPNLENWIILENNIYLNTENGDALRVLATSFNSASISATLGADFTQPKTVGSEVVDEISVEKYTYSFLGEIKKVNLWKTADTVFLEVGAQKNETVKTLEFVESYTKQNSVLGANTPDNSAKLATTTRPSVAMVLNHYCTELKFFNAPNFSLSDKVYPFCLTSVGTGFFISADGLLATNGHIVRNLPSASLYYALASGKIDSLVVDFLGVYFAQKGSPLPAQAINQKLQEAKKNKESLYQIGGTILDLTQKNMLKFQNNTNKYYLQLGNTPAVITEEGVEENNAIVTATLVDSDYAEINKTTGFTSSDVALLKAAPGKYPSLVLGQIEDGLVGSEIQVVGFPIAAASGNALLDSGSTVEPTFTRGLVGAIKLAKGNQKKLIQTDAIINHGNSGGPAVLSDGKVVGIATYGVAVEDGSGSYNYLRDIQDIKDLVQKNNLQTGIGEVNTLWQNGLNSYWINYHRQAVESFTALKEIYPAHPLVDRYLQDSLQKQGTVEDKTPKLTYQKRQMFIYTSGITMLVSFLSIIALIIISKRQKDIFMPPAAPQF